MHEARGAHHFTAEYFHQRLVAEAHPEDGDASRKSANHGHGHTRIARRPGPRRNHEVRMCAGERGIDRDGVVTVNIDFRAED